MNERENKPMNNLEFVRRMQQRRSAQILLLSFIFLFHYLAWAEDTTNKDDNLTLGRFCDISLLRFVGNEAFSEQELKDALLRDGEFTLALRPSTLRTIFCHTLTAGIAAGYAQEGFPDAKVTVSLTDDTNHVIVKIDEGTRFMAGDINIIGAQTIPSQLIRNSLVMDLFKDQNLPWNMLGETADAWRMTSKDRLFEDEPPLWDRGTPINFTDSRMSAIRDAISQKLLNLGYVRATFRVEILRHEKTGTLQIVIDKEGPVASFGRVEIVGNINNSYDQICKLIGISTTNANTFIQPASICQKLWNSGRFENFAVELRQIPGTESSMALRVEVWELPGVPPLSRSPDPLGETLARCSDWVNGYFQGGGRVAVDVRIGNDPDVPESVRNSKVSGVISSSGTQWSIQYGSDTTSNGFGFELESTTFVLFSDSLKQRYEITPRYPLWPQLMFTFLPTDTNVEMLLAFQLKSPFGRESDVPHFAALSISPAAFLELANRKNVTNTFAGGALTIRGSNFVFKIDTNTGEPLTVAFGSAKSSGAISFSESASERIHSETRQRTIRYPNLCTSDTRVTSLFQMLTSVAFDEPLFANVASTNLPPEEKRRLSKALHHFLDERPFAFFDGLYSPTNTDSSSQWSGFEIPADFGMTTRESWLSFLGTIVKITCAQFQPEIEQSFPQNSWPVALTRSMSVTAITGQTNNPWPISQLYDSPAMGPMGYLVASELLMVLQNPEYLQFGLRGLLHLETSDFHRECELLVPKGAPGEKVALDFLRSFGALNSDERKMLAQLFDKDISVSLLEVGDRIANKKSKCDREQLLAFLDAIWNRSLRQYVDNALCDSLGQFEPGLEARGVRLSDLFYKCGMLFYQQGQPTNYEQSILWFKRSERIGGICASYMLGNCFENGKGCETNFAEAVSSYRRAAQAGCAESQAALGRYLMNYAKGTNDLIEAFSWLAIAEQNGQHEAATNRAEVAKRLTDQDLRLARSQIELLKASQFTNFTCIQH